MENHRDRLIAILVAWSLVLAAIVALIVTGNTEGTAPGVVFGLEGTFTLALLDALRVERRRRDPARRAIKDDVGAHDSAAAG